MEAAAQAFIKDEEFAPSVETVKDKDYSTILLHLPGFRREKLNVQLTTDGKLRVSGEKEAENNKVIRFQKEFRISSDINTKKITAKFEGDILYVRLPKLIAPGGKQDSKLTIPERPTPQKPADHKPESLRPTDESGGSQKPADHKPESLRPTDESRGSQKPADEPQQSQKPADKSDISRPTDESTVSQKPADEPRQFQKPADEARPQETVQQKTADKTSPIDGPSKQTDVQDVTQKKPEKEEAKAADMKDKATSETVDGSGKTSVDNYNQSALDPAAKLKMSRRAMDVAVVVLLAVVIGLYIIYCIRCFRRTTED
ncbi:unnamed protein product [Coffea canephora]|uniref:DH200=94 genomic scaffold, scaffold_290 n=1 Tax=Coffea canephora TaxID=49390 RepID=A0A068VDL5_COFCA|nr:unnamed protein product [Coffea canephora]